MWVRVPRLPLSGSSSNRKTPAPHAGNPGATPGESTDDSPVAQRQRQLHHEETIGGSSPSRTTVAQRSPRGAARSARRPVTAEIVGSNPIGDADGTVRKPVKRPNSNLGERLWVRIPPVLLNDASAGHWRAPVAVNHPLRLCRFDSCPAHWKMERQIAARCDVGFAARLSISPTRVQFPSASLWPGVMLVLQPGPRPGRRGFDSRPGH